MSPLPLLPRDKLPWKPDIDPPVRRSRIPREELSEEKLADYHARRLHGSGIFRTMAGVLILTLAAAVVIVPFLYMILISLKGPAQVGNGRFLPDELRGLGNTKAAWLQVRLTDRQAVSIMGLESIPVLPSEKAGFSAWPEPKALPEGTISSRRIGLEKPWRESSDMVVLLEADDPAGSLIRGGTLSVYIPADDQLQTWTPVEATAIPRTRSAVVSRVLVNYRALLDWADLSEGHLLHWISHGYPRWYLNSLFVAISTVLLGVFLDSLAAFAFAKYEFPGKKILFGILLATLMIPYPVTLVPTFFIFAKLGFYNTYAALIVPGVVSAFGIFLVRQYMQNIPNDMIDAARVDGATDFQVYRRIVLPAARPVLAALAVFRFIYQWNTYLYPLVLTNKDSMKTVQLGIATMEDMHGTVDYGLQMAGSALAVIPIVIVYAFMQKHFIAGITMGSAKG